MLFLFWLSTILQNDMQYISCDNEGLGRLQERFNKNGHLTTTLAWSTVTFPRLYPGVTSSGLCFARVSCPRLRFVTWPLFRVRCVRRVRRVRKKLVPMLDFRHLALVSLLLSLLSLRRPSILLISDGPRSRPSEDPPEGARLWNADACRRRFRGVLHRRGDCG